MSDLRTRLERLGERAEVAPDAFERLERARRRHERNRRITAGTVALLVAVAGSFAAFSAFRTGDDPRTATAGAEGGFYALWPEATLAEAEATQAAVKSSDLGLQWRLDPEATAFNFARDALLLGNDFTTDDLTITTDDIDQLPGRVRVHIVTAPQTCPPWSDVDGGACAPSAFTVELARLLRQDGIWSVTMVESPEFDLPVPAGTRMDVGGTLEVETSLPEGTTVQTGFSTTDACVLSDETSTEVSGGLVGIEIPDELEGCDGYVYAIVARWVGGEVSLDDRPIGQIMFGPPDPAVAYQVWSMAALPVRFEDVGPPKPIDVAEFTCDGAGSISPTDATVEARPDGVHIAITDTGDTPVSFSVGELGGDGAEPGERKETVWQLPPGDTTVSCGSAVPGEGGSSSAKLHVSDSEGAFRPAELGCPGAASSEVFDYVEGAVGVQGDPVEVARQHLSGLEFDDVVERAGYPESDLPIVRVVRGGDIVASARFMSDGQGGWLLETLDVCYGVPIAWSDDVTGVSGPMGPTSNAWESLCASARAGEGNNLHSGADLHVDGRDFDFDTGCLIAPAGEPLTILFGNLDAGVPRNIAIYPLTPYLRECLVTGTSPTNSFDLLRPLFSGEFITGVDEIVYEVGPLQPGEYYFQDEVHPSSNGVLLVE